MSNVQLHADDIQGRVVGMYAKHPFPAYSDKFRKASEEMYLKMRLLGLAKADYHNKSILDCGCGTGEFTCWYAAQGNSVTAIDLSGPSLAHAEAYAKSYELADRIKFRQMSILDIDFPDNTFDLVYSYGVLHHTADPYKGFENMVRVCKPGGYVIVSVYNKFSRFRHAWRQRLINALAGEDVEKRFVWGKRLFPLTARKLKLRAHDDSDAVLYDQFSIPHESLHTAGEVLGWLDNNGMEYVGAFGPLRLHDYFHAVRLPEYERFEETFAGYALSQAASSTLKFVAGASKKSAEPMRSFPRPSVVSRFLVQAAWFFLGLRFSCFSIAGRKLAGNGNS